MSYVWPDICALATSCSLLRASCMCLSYLPAADCVCESVHPHAPGSLLTRSHLAASISALSNSNGQATSLLSRDSMKLQANSSTGLVARL